jgi:hypothetical protein
MLRRQRALRVGALPEPIERRLSSGDSVTLLRRGEGVLHATTADEVFMA